MLQQEGVIRAGQPGDELLDVIVRHDDKVMAFIWRDKRALAFTAGLVTFLTDPEAYIDGTKDLIIDGVAGPAAEVGKVAAQNTNWTALGLAAIGVFGAVAAWNTWLRRPKTGTA